MRFGRILLALALAASLVLLAAPPVDAATITVTTTDDVVAADGVTSLREAIATASTNGVDDVVVLGASELYVLDLCLPGRLEHADPADLLIDGNDSTIEQTCADEPVLTKTDLVGATTELRNLTLVSAPNTLGSQMGATVDASSQLILDGVTVDGADAGGGSAIKGDFGPALFDLIVRNSSITNTVGTGISNGNNFGVQVINSVVTGNSGSGLGVSDGSPIEIVGSDFSQNGGSGIVGSGQGNGLQPDVTITDSTFANNGNGGFICLASCRTIVVTDSQFIDNGLTAFNSRGGGIVMPIVVQGGVVPSLTVTGSTFTGNRSDHPGGAIWAFASFDSFQPDQPPVVISDSVFTDNAPTCAGCGGGAVAVSMGSLAVENSTFTDNSAFGDGGAILHERNEGAAATDPVSLTVSGSQFTGNDSDGDGGAIASQVDTAAVEDSSFTGNEAGGNGGAMWAGGVFDDALVVSGDTTIDGSTFTDNTAFNGGAVGVSFPDGSTVTATNVTVHDNTASNAGGGFVVGPTELLDLVSSTVSSNSAPAGANVATNGPTTFVSSILDDPQGGGANCGAIPGVPILVVPNVVSQGFNVFSDVSCPAAGDDSAGVGSLLGSLQDNGGPTFTQIPAAGSPALGAVPLSECGVATDQRGVARPAGFACEAGSVELDEPLPALPDGFPASQSGSTLVLTGTNDADRFDVERTGSVIEVRYDEEPGDPASPVLTGLFDASTVRDVRVNGRAGDDELAISGLELEGRLSINSAAGDDLVELSDIETERGVVVTTGTGDDVVQMSVVITDQTLSVNTGNGEDAIGLFTSSLGRLRVSSGSGADTFTFSGGSVAGLMRVYTGADDDMVTLAELSVTGPGEVSLGGGDDSLRVFVSGWSDRVTFTGRSGDDSMELNDSTFAGRSRFLGGAGTDSYAAPGSSFTTPPILRQFEP